MLCTSSRVASEAIVRHYPSLLNVKHSQIPSISHPKALGTIGSCPKYNWVGSEDLPRRPGVVKRAQGIAGVEGWI